MKRIRNKRFKKVSDIYKAKPKKYPKWMDDRLIQPPLSGTQRLIRDLEQTGAFKRILNENN